MRNDQLSAMEHTLQQLVAGQAMFGTRLDTMDGRLDKIDDRLDKIDDRLDRIDGRLDTLDGRLNRIDGRLDRIDGRLDALDDKVQLLAEAQKIAQDHTTKGFNGIREEFNHRLVPLETAVRRLSVAAPARNDRPAAARPRKRTPRR